MVEAFGPGLHRPQYGPQVKVLGDKLYIDVGAERPAPVGSVFFEDDAGLNSRSIDTCGAWTGMGSVAARAKGDSEGNGDDLKWRYRRQY